ncbi:MAG: adenylate kinase [Pseudomonadota bacterium]
MLGKKVIISGPSCTGKTTLGLQLADKLNRPQIDLDDFHFLPNWVCKDPKLFVSEVNSAVDQHESWIVSGGYHSKLKATLWPKADTIIWLDLPLHIILTRYFKRTYRRVRFQEPCCGENYETLGHVIFKDNMLLHILKTYGPRKERLADWRYNRFADKQWIVPTNPEEVRKLIDDVPQRKPLCA